MYKKIYLTALIVVSLHAAEKGAMQTSDLADTIAQLNNKLPLGPLPFIPMIRFGDRIKQTVTSTDIIANPFFAVEDHKEKEEPAK